MENTMTADSAAAPAVNYIACDIETQTGPCPITGAARGLDPRVGGIVSVAFYSAAEQCVFNSLDERALLFDVAAYVTNPAREPGVIVTWNGGRFDLPFLATRAAMLGITPLSDALRLTPDTRADRLTSRHSPIGGHAGGYAGGVGPHEHIDLMYAYAVGGKFRGLKRVARDAGIDVIEVDREKIHELTASELMAYNVSDVHATYELAVRFEGDLLAWSDRYALEPVA